jgi:hypothetical protein
VHGPLASKGGSKLALTLAAKGWLLSGLAIRNFCMPHYLHAWNPTRMCHPRVHLQVLS